MRIESEQKIRLVTRIEALAALWCVKLRLGQCPCTLHRQRLSRGLRLKDGQPAS